MGKFGRSILMTSVALAGLTAAAQAADVVPPVVYEPPAPVAVSPPPVVKAAGGWYIRGDIGYAVNDFDHANFAIAGVGDVSGELFDGLLEGDLDGGFTLGGGVGYDTGNHLRADLTIDYLFDSDFEGSTSGFCNLGTTACSSVDTTTFSALSIMANAYVDLGTYHFGEADCCGNQKGITPYIGAGIGGTYVKWDDLNNTIPPGYPESGTVVHPGQSDWRFSWALMAGASIDLTHNLALDAGYRYRRIEGGEMFGTALNSGYGRDEGINQHEFRAGLRYALGKTGCTGSCGTPEIPDYTPPPVYK